MTMPKHTEILKLELVIFPKKVWSIPITISKLLPIKTFSSIKIELLSPAGDLGRLKTSQFYISDHLQMNESIE